MSLVAANTLLELMPDIRTSVRDVSGQVVSDSLADLAQPTRVEPMCIMSNDLVNAEYTQDILQTSLNLVTAFYMQALPMVNTESGVEAVRVLKRLNPSATIDVTDIDRGLANLSAFANESLQPNIDESYTYGLPTDAVRVATEADKQGGKSLDNPANLVVGKNIEVKVKGANDATVSLPVTIRLTTIPVTQRVAVGLMAMETVDSTWTERYYKWRAGRIRFWRDLIFADDLIKNRKKMMLEDKNGILEEVNRRRTSAIAVAASGGGRNYGITSNVMIVSDDIFKEVGKKHRASLSKSAKARETVMRSLGVMVLVVVDKEYEQVTFFYLGGRKGTSLPVKSLKRVSKNNGPDMTEVLKALTSGNSLTF